MGRKPLPKTKARIKLSVEEELIKELREDGVNISRLFSLSANKYLRKKRKLNKNLPKKTK